MGFFITAVILAVGSLVFTLFVRSQDIPEVPPVSPTFHLDEKKARIYENLRDLQFEYRVGKLSDDDYQKTKQGLQKELAVVLAEIDAILKPGTAAVAAKATAPSPAPMPAPKPKPDGKLCPHCGAHFERMLKFCGECGKAMAS
jgi:hypothetical protein